MLSFSQPCSCFSPYLTCSLIRQKDKSQNGCYKETKHVKFFKKRAFLIFHQQVKNDTRTYDNIREITIGQGDDCTAGCLLDYSYFKEHYQMITIYLSKQQGLDAVPKAIQ